MWDMLQFHNKPERMCHEIFFEIYPKSNNLLLISPYSHAQATEIIMRTTCQPLTCDIKQPKVKMYSMLSGN